MQIKHSINPLNLSTGINTYTVPDGSTPNSAIQILKLVFLRPTILLVNGNPWGRCEWNTSLPNGSDVVFVEFPRGSTALIIISLVISGVSFAYSLITSSRSVVDKPIEQIDQKSSNSFSDGTNRIRIGNIFVEHFGRCRVYPDLIQQSYVRNESRYGDDANYQYLYFLGIIGIGEYDIEGVYIDNTPLTEYENSEYFIFAPGEWGVAPGSSAWNLAAATYDNLSTYVGSEEDFPGFLTFKADGSKMYIGGVGSDIYQYSLSSPWDIETAVYDSVSFNVYSQAMGPEAVEFKSDGTKMYVLDSTYQGVHQYTLSTPWIISSATYDGVAYSVGTQDSRPISMKFNSDGSKMYINGFTNKRIYQYTLSTPWDLSTVSYDSIYRQLATYQYYDDFYFKSDGTKLYITLIAIDGSVMVVEEFVLSTAWSLSDVTYNDVYFNLKPQNAFSGISFKSDGTKMYVLSYSSKLVHQYSLSLDASGVDYLVWTCNELAVQELNYGNWITAIVSAPQTEIDYIEYDIVFQNGLYCTETGSYQDSIQAASAIWRAEARKVDDDGSALTEWINIENKTYWAATRDPIRLTFKVPVPFGIGRYQIRFIRVETDFDEPLQTLINGPTAQTAPTLSGIRGYGPPHPDYGDVTVLFARIKATDQLNGSVASQINVVATRKLGEVTNTGISETLVATRSIIDAIGYLMTASNCGNQSDSLIDWETLDTLRATFETAEYYFDHRFTNRVSVMDSVAMAAACGRAVPYMPGGMFSVVQDVDQEIPSCVFTDDNITNLTITTNPKTADSPTCVNIKYIDPDTWDEKTISCYDGDGSADVPIEVPLDGCTSRQQAYEIGMFLYLQNKLERTSVSFVTDVSGYIPQLLSKILVPNKMTNWGASGLIVAVESDIIWLSEPVDFDGESSGLMYITLEDGTAGGPYTVTPTEYAHAVAGSIPVFNTLNDDGLKATRFLFGINGDNKLLMRVNSIVPQGRDSIKISGTIVNHDVYNNPGTAPGTGVFTWDQNLLDSINLIYLGESSDGHEFQLTWAGDAETVRIELDEDSGGYAILEDDYSDHEYLFNTTADDISIKVTPYESDLVTEDAIKETWSYEENSVGPIENLTFPSLTNVSTVRSVAFTDDATSIVTWGSSQEQSGGALIYTVNDPPTGDDDYTIRDNNKVVLNPTKWQDSIEANILGLLNVDTRQGT